MQKSVRSLQPRSSEDFSHRNIYICQTVFKLCLRLRILKIRKGNGQVGHVAAPAHDLHKGRAVQYLNHILLNLFIFLFIQIIDLPDFLKNLLKLLPDGRQRIGDDRKAPLILIDKFIHQRIGFRRIFHQQVLLPLAETIGLRLALRLKRNLSEHLEAGRPGKALRLLGKCFIGLAHAGQLPVQHPLVKVNGLVKPVIIIVLLIRVGGNVSHLQVLSLIQCIDRSPVNDRLQSHFPELINRSPDDPLKSDIITDIDRFLFGQIHIFQGKAFPVAVCKSKGDLINFLLRQTAQILCHTYFIF